ncbi:hypothetical protein BD779DRAFT_1477389 [Infundibulicybe gibba]|nr:hypothetical protein BD779DRAFT_1477389 [Infundibulicybe gibba]
MWGMKCPPIIDQRGRRVRLKKRNLLDDGSERRQQIASRSKGAEDRGLANVAKNAKWMEQLRIECFEEPKTWRLLVVANDNDDTTHTMEEAVFTIQGVLMQRQAGTRCRYLRQGITIMGLGSPTFEYTMNVVVDISRMFDWQFPEGNPGEYDKSWVCSWRRKRGWLLYYSQEDGEERFQVAKPQVFRIGDLVEVQVSFAVVPLKGGKYKMLSVLRSIALLDGQFAQKRVMTKKINNEVKVTLKRRVGYNTAEGSGEKKANMDVDGSMPNV